MFPRIIRDIALAAWRRITGTFRIGTSRRLGALAITGDPLADVPFAALCDFFEGLYLNVAFDAYEESRAERSLPTAPIKPLRTPCYRAVEFYASHIWPGRLPEALPIVPAKGRADALIAAIQQVWQWSNWSEGKQLWARRLPMLGEVIVKVATAGGPQVNRVYFQHIHPRYVTQIDLDERGNVAYIRIDKPQQKRDGDELRSFTYTEIWSKAGDAAGVRIWNHDEPIDTPVDRLGTPDPELSRTFAQLGFDFIPIAYCRFRWIAAEGSVYANRGISLFQPVAEKIIDVCRQQTKHSRTLFRTQDTTWAVFRPPSTGDARPMPPPQVDALEGTKSDTSDGTLDLGGERVVALPAGWDLKSLIPNIDFTSAIAEIDASMREIQRDLPELLYYELAGQDLSGTAIRALLSPAIASVLEARGASEAALVRLDQMALTIGQVAGLPGFDGLGAFDAGDFAHSFGDREVLPLSPGEEAEIIGTLVSQAQVGVEQAARFVGKSEQEAKALAQSDFVGVLP